MRNVRLSAADAALWRKRLGVKRQVATGRAAPVPTPKCPLCGETLADSVSIGRETGNGDQSECHISCVVKVRTIRA